MKLSIFILNPERHPDLLYVEHHVWDGLLPVLLAVVEEDLLAAYNNVLPRQQQKLISEL